MIVIRNNIMKAKKKTKQRERKSDALIVYCAKYSKRPKLASVRLDKKLVNMINTCRTRDKKLELQTLITTSMLREKVKHVLGEPCKYCGTILDHNNISLDHIVPLARGGNSSEANVQFICNICNRQKDKMLEQEFKQLKELINSFSEISRIYVNRKLSMNGGHYDLSKGTQTESKEG
ncbi:MAG: HNH endonuclease [Spirochaetia bacterium]|nr:HNH endonuclease [Spirochaetia bacterium]